jgi:hypothetical protein|tara:strand:- start:1026 stop:1886 length:861 start_codon:yes stop_codon:yes gene_type:complete
MPDRNGYIGRAPADSAVTVARQSFNVSGVTTDFTFSSGYVPGYFDIYINGVKQIEGSDYTSSDSSTFHILNGGADDGDVIEAVAYKAFNAAAVVSTAADLTVSGNLTVNGTSTLGAGTSVSFATTAFNLSGSPDITVRNITGVGATFSGVVTYEDVTNVDSVGIVTARSGLVVNAGGANIGGGLTVTGVSTFFNNVQFGTAGVGGTITPDGNVEFTGIVTASDGRLIAGVGINSAGAIIGTGITTLNFIGTGNTFAVNGTTMDISIQGGSGSGGGDSLDVTASLFI